jgi:hypothetical protein
MRRICQLLWNRVSRVGLTSNDAMPDRRDASRVRHAMFEMVMARVCAIACGHEDAIDLYRLRQHDAGRQQLVKKLRQLFDLWLGPSDELGSIWGTSG